MPEQAAAVGPAAVQQASAGHSSKATNGAVQCVASVVRSGVGSATAEARMATRPVHSKTATRLGMHTDVHECVVYLRVFYQKIYN